MKKLQLTRLLVLLLLAAFIWPGKILAQTSKKITGKVTAETGEALTGVTVQVKGSSTIATTNDSGSYSINVPAMKPHLYFLMLVMQNKK
jgi:hypothetical protein